MLTGFFIWPKQVISRAGIKIHHDVAAFSDLCTGGKAMPSKKNVGRITPGGTETIKLDLISGCASRDFV
jgi:hypothetical protein